MKQVRLEGKRSYVWTMESMEGPVTVVTLLGGTLSMTNVVLLRDRRTRWTEDS